MCNLCTYLYQFFSLFPSDRSIYQQNLKKNYFDFLSKSRPFERIEVVKRAMVTTQLVGLNQ